MPRALPWLLALALGVGAGCGDDTEPAPEEPLTTAVYGDPLKTQLLPYPSDRYTVADASTNTGLRVAVGPETTGDVFIGGYPLVVQRLAEMDGFSTAGGFAIGFDRPIDGSAFAGSQGGVAPEAIDPAAFTTAEAAIVLLDIDPDSPERGKVFGLLPRYFEQAKDDYYPIDEFTIVARPTEPLLPATKYMFVATRRLLDKDGKPVGRSAETEALLEAEPADDYAALVQSGLAVLEQSVGIAARDVVVASAFTTASITETMQAISLRAREAPAPAMVEPWTVQQESDTDDRVRFRATFESPEYRDKGGDWTFQLGEDGAPIAQEVVPIEAYLAFSDATVSGPRPVVIFQHGLGGDKDGNWGTSERLSDLGVAVFSIDSPEHGSRGGAEGVLQSVLAFFGIDDQTGEFDIARARDNFRQMASDQLELVRLIDSLGELDLLPVGAPDGVPDLDVSRILYIGHSFGSVQGPTLFAMAPEVQLAVWNVGGDNVMQLLEDSDVFSLMVDSMKPPGTADGSLARFLSATQAIVDPGDPINYARFALKETFPGVAGGSVRSILLQEVVRDTIVPNSTSNALARATGLSLMNPVVPPLGMPVVESPSTGGGPNGSTAVMCQFATMNGGEVATHGELIFTEEARDQYVEFFRTGLTGRPATVVSPQ